jgi:hypothetical protein
LNEKYLRIYYSKTKKQKQDVIPINEKIKRKELTKLNVLTFDGKK